MREDVCGKCNEENDLHDLIEVVILRRGTDDVDNNSIFDYLYGVYNSDIEKINEYVSTTPEIESEVKVMSGFGANIAKNSFAKGKDIGLVEGRLGGRLEGETMFAKLIQYLLKNNKNSDIDRVTVDEEYRKQMYREAGIID